MLDEDRILILSETEKLSSACQQLQVCAKTPVQGKSAIFQKVIEYNRCVIHLADAFIQSDLQLRNTISDTL